MGKNNFRYLWCLIFLLAGCKSKSANVNKNAHSLLPDKTSQLIMRDMKVQSYTISGVEWEMKAAVGEAFPTKNLMEVENMQVELYRDNEKSSTITAQEAFLNSSSPGSEGAKPTVPGRDVVLEPGDTFFQGNVVLISTDGSTLHTDWGHYHRKENIIRSSAPVEVVRADSITKGIGLEATPDLSSLKIFNQTLLIKDTEQVNP